MSFTGLLNTTLDLQRVTETADSVGGVTKSWASQGYVKARISSISSNERTVNDKIYTDATHKVFMDAVDIREMDKLVWDSTWTFEVLGIVNPSEAYHHLEVYVREIE